MCEGKGWRWVGVSEDNAEREACELCEGRGEGGLDWATVLTVMCTLAGWGAALGLIWWATIQ